MVGGLHKWVVPCNWKRPAENFGGDGYHVGWSHLSAIKTGFSGDFRINPETGGTAISPGNGHCIITSGPDDVTDPPVPELLAYEQQIRPEYKSRLGPRTYLVNPVAGTIFPNFSMLRAASRTFRVWHPKGPDRIEIWSWAFVDKAAPPEIKEALRLADVRGFSPSGTFEQDDMDNGQGCTRSGLGVVSRRQQLNIQMGLGHDRFDEALNAWASDFPLSESNHRGFYRRWSRLMAGHTWADTLGHLFTGS